MRESHNLMDTHLLSWKLKIKPVDEREKTINIQSRPYFATNNSKQTKKENKQIDKERKP